MLGKQAKGESGDDDFHLGLNASRCKLQFGSLTLAVIGQVGASPPSGTFVPRCHDIICDIVHRRRAPGVNYVN